MDRRLKCRTNPGYLDPRWDGLPDRLASPMKAFRGVLALLPWLFLGSAPAAGWTQAAVLEGDAAPRPIQAETHRASFPGQLLVTNAFEAQPLRFRLEALPSWAPVGAASNITLLRADPPLELRTPPRNATPSDALSGRLDFTQPPAKRASEFQPGVEPVVAGGLGGQPLDLLQHRGLGVKLVVEWAGLDRDAPCPVLNFQWEAAGKNHRDHLVNLDFAGEKTIALPEPVLEQTGPEGRPADGGDSSQAGKPGFDYRRIVALNLRWMRPPARPGLRCRVALLEALAVEEAVLMMPEFTIGDTRLSITAALRTGDYAELRDDGRIRVVDRTGDVLTVMDPFGGVPTLQPGMNRLGLRSGEPAAGLLTLFLKAAGRDRPGPGKALP
jgi:hypothetical protein